MSPRTVNTTTAIMRVRRNFAIANNLIATALVRRSLVLAQNRYQLALYLHRGLRHVDGLHRGIGRLEAHVIAGLRIEALERRLHAFDQRDHRLAIARIRGFLDQDVVSIADMVLDHRIAAHFEREGVGVAREISEVEGVLSRDRLDWRTCSDSS